MVARPEKMVLAEAAGALTEAAEALSGVALAEKRCSRNFDISGYSLQNEIKGISHKENSWTTRSCI